jgi:hypothetical protein
MTGECQKACTNCKAEKPLADFRERKKGTGVLMSWCKDCQNVYSKARAARLVRERRGLPADHPAMMGSRPRKPEGYTFTEARSGYEWIKASGHHRADKYGWALAHILVAEKKYGITITRDFSVHHVNGDRADNRPENLELRWGNHGKGADVLPGLLRSPEMRAVARSVLAQYDDG